MSRTAPKYRDATKYLKGEGKLFNQLGCIPFNPLSGVEKILLLDVVNSDSVIGAAFNPFNRYFFIKKLKLKIPARADAAERWAKYREDGVFFTLTLADDRHYFGFVKKQADLTGVMAELTALKRMETPDTIRNTFPNVSQM